MNLKFTFIFGGVLSIAFTACDSGSSSSALDDALSSSYALGEGASSSSAAGEVSPESSASETAKGSFAAYIDTAAHKVSYYTPTCNSVGGSAVFSSNGDTVNASYALSGDSLLWNEEGDASVFTGDNSGALFGSWTAALDDELPGATIKMKISPNSVKPEIDFSGLCFADIIQSEWAEDEDDSEKEAFDRKDCNHISYTTNYSGISVTLDISASATKHSFSVATSTKIPGLDVSPCTTTTTMQVLSEDLCTIENLATGEIEDGIYSSTITTGDCLEGTENAAVIHKAMKSLIPNSRLQ